MKNQTLVFVPLLFFTTVSAESEIRQDPELLTLKTAIQTALAHHPRLQEAQHQIEAAEARVEQAKSTYFPQVDAGGTAKQGLSGSGSAFGLRGLAASPRPDDMAASVNVYQDLLDFGRTKHEAAARRPELEYFRETFLVEKSQVIREVRKAYYQALKARKLTELAKQTVKEGRITLRQAQAFYRAQLKSKMDVRLAQVDVSRAELGLVNARNELAHTFAVLSNTMGLEGSPSGYILEEPLIDIEPPEALGRMLAAGLEQRPDIHAIDARIAANKHWVKRAKSERYPKIMGAFSGGWTRFAELSLGKLLFGGFAFKLPLFTGRRLEASIDEAKRNLEEVKAARTTLVQSIHLEISSAYHHLITAVETVKANQEIIKQAEEALRLARIRYRMELSDFVELVAAQTSQISAHSQYARAVYDYKIGQSELRYAVGRIK